MRIILVRTAGAALLSLAVTAGAAPEVASPLSALPQEQQRECEAFGETYLRIAELRDAGADRSVAINRGVEFLSKLGRTGSHHRGMNYQPAVTGFADFVYANPKLYRTTLYLYGLSSCAISKKAPDDAGFEAAMAALEKSLGRCQVRHAAVEQARELGSCILGPVNAQMGRW